MSMFSCHFNIDRWLHCLCCVGITCVHSPWLVSQLPLLRTWCLGCHTTLEDCTSRSTDVYPINEWNLAMTTAVHRHVHTQLTYNYIFNTKVTFFGWFHHSQLVQLFSMTIRSVVSFHHANRLIERKQTHSEYNEPDNPSTWTYVSSTATVIIIKWYLVHKCNEMHAH